LEAWHRLGARRWTGRDGLRFGRAASVQRRVRSGRRERLQELQGTAEGHYIETYGNGRGYSATGECGCDVTRVRKTGPSAYRLSTICRCNDAPTPQPEEATVVVTSPREIRIDGRRYLRCK
jgi:hypothetical protein